MCAENYKCDTWKVLSSYFWHAYLLINSHCTFCGDVIIFKNENIVIVKDYAIRYVLTPDYYIAISLTIFIERYI